MLASELRSAPETPSTEDWERAAFHELHGRSLHGFALLLTLGDLDRAAWLAGTAIGAGMARIDQLRHPERAAAWLRARVLKAAKPRSTARPDRPGAVFQGLGASAAVGAGLGALDVLQRAAFIAAFVEHLDQRDVAAIVGRDGERLHGLLISARRRYLSAYLRAAPDDPPLAGPLTDRLHEIGWQTIG